MTRRPKAVLVLLTAEDSESFTRDMDIFVKKVF